METDFRVEYLEHNLFCRMRNLLMYALSNLFFRKPPLNGKYRVYVL